MADRTGEVHILVAGDDELILSGVQTALSDDADVTSRLISDADDLHRLITGQRPDLLVACVERITAAQTESFIRFSLADETRMLPVLVITGFASEWSPELLRNGLCVILRSEVSRRQLSAVVTLLTAGYLPIPRGGAEDVLAHYAAQGNPAENNYVAEKLTKREQEVFHLIWLGMTNPEIATALSISRSTVKSHVESILDKLNLTSRVQVIRCAGLLPVQTA
jgi:DNA-binding NarL/FixJ family response regulator